MISVDLTGKSVIITGGDGGLGTGIVDRFAEAGASVAVHYATSGDGAARTVAALTERGVPALAVGADIRDPEAFADIVAQVEAAFGGVDILVNNAGVQPVRPFETLTKQEWDEVVGVNLTGTFVATQATIPALKRRGGGSVICIASIEATAPALNHIDYNASKAGVVMFARAAALELGAHGIRVNTVSPGLVDRGDLESTWPQGRAKWLATVPLKRTVRPADIGNACVFLASELGEFMSGQDIVVDGGMSTVSGWH